MLENDLLEAENDAADDEPEFDDCVDCGDPVLVLFGRGGSTTKCLDCSDRDVE